MLWAQFLILNTAVAAFSTVPKNKSVSQGEKSVGNEKDLPYFLNINQEDSNKYTSIPGNWWMGNTIFQPNRSKQPIPERLQEAILTNTHPEESQEELGEGLFLWQDWRKVYYTYQDDTLIDDFDGFAEYEIDDIEGEVPHDLVGVLYRNGPGKFGVGEERVVHALDADGLVIKIDFPEPNNGDNRKFTFTSRFVETNSFVAERRAGRFLDRRTFGTGPRGFAPSLKNGLNEDPSPEPILSRMFGNAFKTSIANNSNTNVIAFGGKVLSLFEAGLPYELDPVNLKTIGEYDMKGQGNLKSGKLAVKIENIPDGQGPDFLGGAAHTAHPQMCPETGHLVGWTWSQLPSSNSMEVTFTEWKDGFEVVASATHTIPNCNLAPHDFAMTDSHIIFKCNALELDQVPFIFGAKGPAEALKMDGRAPVKVHVFPRPNAKKTFEAFQVEVPACFSIHFTHAYVDDQTGNIVTMFSGWPPSDATSFLGAWGGFAPDFRNIPPTFLWRLEIDPKARKTVDLSIAPGASNVVLEHPWVHPNFTTKKAQNVYTPVANVIGESTMNCGYARLQIESGSRKQLKYGERNNEIEAYWFGTRYFVAEPVIVPKVGANLENENEAYLLGTVYDMVRGVFGIPIFDLEQSMKNGPVAILWMKTHVPYGLHGCFADHACQSSVFC